MSIKFICLPYEKSGICYFYAFAFIMFSCSNEDNDTERHIMKDGKVVYTYPDVKFYGDKESFRDAVLEIESIMTA